MFSQRSVIFGFIILISLLAVQLTATATGEELAVQVFTNKPEYALGETVTITVQVTFNGQPIAATIDQAWIEINYNGIVQHRYITRKFIQVSPGVFIAQGVARQPGIRTVHVIVHATITTGPCCYTTICGSGTTTYTVVQTCTCQPCSCCCYYYYPPCPPPPPVECRKPDFFVKHFVDALGPGEERWVSFQLPDYILDQLHLQANPVTFREAPPHSVIWSDIPGLGWTNDPLADLGLVLDPETGRISGRLKGEMIHKENYFFFIEALNPAGEVIAGIWIEIAFI